MNMLVIIVADLIMFFIQTSLVKKLFNADFMMKQMVLLVLVL